MKNLLLFSALLLTSISAFAQLTVKPSSTAPASDAYIYVNNQVLYVANDVNLTPNNTSTKEASIYLRNNGQLIQSGSTSSNTGTGFLSVQQNTPKTNAWGYYLWCSPIGNPASGVSTSVGNNKYFGVNSIYDAQGAVLAANKAATTTAPNGLLTSPITISTRWLYTFMTPGTEKEGSYVRMNSLNSVPAGFGFTMKGVGTNIPGIDQVYDFRGRPNSGNFTIPVGNGLMTLSGNPYPSALDLNQLYYDNPALEEVWYYDEDRSIGSHNYANKPFGYGTWVPELPDTDGDLNDNNPPGQYVAASFSIWNAAGGSTSTSGNGGNDQNKRYAPVGQGFMLVGNSAGNVVIKNTHRIYHKEGTGGSVFQRPEGKIALSDNEEQNSKLAPEVGTAREDHRLPHMRIYAIFGEKGITRDMVLTFTDQATDGYDRGFDGRSPMDMSSDAYFPIPTQNDADIQPYVIQAVNYAYEKQIPITFTLDKQTKFEVKAVQEVKKPYDEAYLFDKEEYTYTQITSNKSATLNLPKGEYKDRFYIAFRAPNGSRETEEADLIAKGVVDNVSFYQNNKLGVLEVKNPEGYNIVSANIFDMSGKLVVSQKNVGDSRNFSFQTGNLSDGVYLVKLLTDENVSIDYKSIVKNQ